MAKSKAAPAPPPVPASGDSFWPAFILIALLSGGSGAFITYLVLQPRLQPSSGTSPSQFVPASADSAPHRPGPELTAGQPPAQADRTLGNFYYDHSNWAEAVKYYESAIRLGADDADIRTDLGNAYQFSGRTAEALAQYNTAQRLNPQHEFSLFNQGGLYMERRHDAAKAIAVWKEYLLRFPQGRSAAAARQLIAQAEGQATGLMPVAAPGATAAAAPDATETRLMKLVKPKP